MLHLFMLTALIGCHPDAETGEHEHHQLTPTREYATGFRTARIGNGTLLEVMRPYLGAESSLKYLLIHRGDSVPVHDPAVPVIFTPLRSIVCTSTTHIPLLDALGETDKLIGFPTTDYISSAAARKRIDEGHVAELGVDKGMDLEKLVLLKPDLVMGYSVTGGLDQFKKIESMGIPVVINAEYLEGHPLGRAEWIKFMGLFFEKTAAADSVFSSIEARYKQVASLLANSTTRPDIMSGIIYGDAWFLPGGRNYAARLLGDAGCHYLWSSDTTTGFLQLSPEAVFEKASRADFWIGVGSFHTLQEMEDADKRYTRFKPFQTGQVYTYDARKGATGGSEFLELGYLRPDIILTDLVLITHPGIASDSTELYFHKRLGEIRGER